MKPYFELLEHGADYGVRGIGNNWAEAFAECAKAMCSILKNLDGISGLDKIKIKVTAADREQLLVKWLNELLYQMHEQMFLFKDFKIEKLTEQKGQWVLEADAIGEKVDFKKEAIAIEVKGASYTGLKVEEQGEKFVVQCIVDV